jgi:hypothetical protein
MDDAPENILGISQKENQRRQNYQRAEAFLRWKFGNNYYHIEDSIRGSGEDWPSLFVEFVERVEADLLSRMQYIEQAHWDTVMMKKMMDGVTLSVDDFSIGKEIK